MFDILLLELEPVCTAEQEFVQKFFDFTLDEPEVCVCGHIVDCIQFVFFDFGCHLFFGFLKGAKSGFLLIFLAVLKGTLKIAVY